MCEEVVNWPNSVDWAVQPHIQQNKQIMAIDFDILIWFDGHISCWAYEANFYNTNKTSHSV